MQWDRLIDELEADLDADVRRELVGEVADRTRREVARLHVVDRLRAAAGSTVTLGLEGCEPVRGSLGRVGTDWLLLHDSSPGAVLVLDAAILWIDGLPARAVDPAAVPVLDRRLGVQSVLRATARDRRVVQIRLRDGSELRGTVSRVGADYLDLGAEPRQAVGQRCIPLAAIAMVRLG